MKKEREDWEAPALPKPIQLNANEQLIVYRELKRGASEDKLARYFDTSISEIRIIREIGDINEWK